MNPKTPPHFLPRIVAAAFAAVTVVTVRTAAQSPGPLQSALPRSAVLTDKEAYFLLPPDVVAGPHIREMTASSDKNYLVVERIAMPPVRDPFEQNSPPKQSELSLILWSVASRQGTVIWKRTVPPSLITDFPRIVWLEGTATALLQEVPSGTEAELSSNKNVTKGRLLLLDASLGTVRVLASELDPQAELIDSGVLPVAALYASETNTIRLIGPSGFQGSAVGLHGTLGKNPSFYWRVPGKTLSAMFLAPSAADPEKAQYHHALVNVATGEITEENETVARAALKAWAKQFKSADGPPLPPLKFKSGEVALTESDSKAVVHPLWLEGKAAADTGRIFVAPDTENYSDILASPFKEEPGLLPDAVLYKANGTLFAAPLLTMSKTAYLKKRQDFLKQIAMQNGKQIALALMMYSQDYDEFLPLPGGDLKNTVGPYLKNDTAFQDPETGALAFSLTYTDTSMSRNMDKKPLGTLGYLSAFGGRAVIYFDGHIRWEPSPPAP